MTPQTAADSFLPDFCGSRMVFVVVLLAELLAATITLAAPDAHGATLVTLSLNSLLAQAVALFCIGALCALKDWFRTLPETRAAALSYLTTLLVSAAVIEAAWRALPIYQDVLDPRLAGHLPFLLRSLGVSAITWALALRYFYVRHQWRRRIESEADARFQALQSRIRPHFLFNCMNTIASLTRSSPRLAEEAVEDLADLFRASLAEARRGSTLAEELELCRRYLRIEQHRLGNRLQVSWQGAEPVAELRLPPLTLQPLLENAIYHGIEPLPGGGTIDIRCSADADALQVEIANPLPAGEPAGKLHDGNRLAQENVAQRLEAFFGRRDLLAVTLEPGRYRVSVRLPLAHEDPDR